MKKHLIIAFLIMVIQQLTAQEGSRKMLLTVGIVPDIDTNMVICAINFSNDFSYHVNVRISINHNVAYFHTLADFGAPSNERKEFRQDYASGLFVNLKLHSDILK